MPVFSQTQNFIIKSKFSSIKIANTDFTFFCEIQLLAKTETCSQTLNEKAFLFATYNACAFIIVCFQTEKSISFSFITDSLLQSALLVQQQK